MSDASREANTAVVRRFIDAVNEWDFEALHNLLALDFVFEMPHGPPGVPHRIEGRDAFLEFVRPLTEVFDQERLQDVRLDTLASDPGEIVAEYRSDMNVLATGAKYQNTYVTRFTVRDEKITRFAEFFDPILLVVALGGRVEFDPATL